MSNFTNDAKVGEKVIFSGTEGIIVFRDAANTIVKSLNMLESHDRIALYSNAFPKFEPLYLSKTGRIEGLWIMGNNYKTSGYYGAYPHGYLPRIQSLFPDCKKIIHVCSGSLPVGDYTRVDVRPEVNPEICCNAEEMSGLVLERFDIAYVDVPYSAEDAEHYGTVMLKRKKVLEECYKILKPGGWVIWLDQVLPMFSKKKWFFGLAIGMVKSTNHRVRGVFGFKKVEAI